MARALTISVDASEFARIIDGLRKFDAAAEKRVISEITKGGKAVAANAASRISGTPLSGWGKWIHNGRDLSFDPGAVRAGFKLKRSNFVRNRQSRGIGWRIEQTNAGGSVFEVIGNGSRINSLAGGWFVGTINDRFPQRQPRSLFAAYYATNTPQFQERIDELIFDEARKAGLI